MIAQNSIKEVGKASIREIKRLINDIENASGTKFVRMENFIDLDISPESCFPTVGSMMAGLVSFMTLARREKQKDTTLFIDPGFPVQKNQHKILGLKYETFDVYDFRGAKLRDKLESYLKKGNIHSIIYSNPNNPSWICFTDEELRIIGELATQYDVCVIEDLAYFGMDFRRDISKPGVPPGWARGVMRASSGTSRSRRATSPSQYSSKSAGRGAAARIFSGSHATPHSLCTAPFVAPAATSAVQRQKPGRSVATGTSNVALPE